MKPTYLILYAALITLVLTIALPRMQDISPTVKRFLWIAAVAGLVILGLVAGALAILQ